MSLDGKIQALNHAIHESIPAMQGAASENPFAKVLVRAIAFSTGARWHISQPTLVDDFRWTDLDARDGVTDMGKALSMLADQLKIPPMTDRGLPPVLALISDGQPTDDFSSGLKELLAQPWGKRAVRIAIAIGQDADLDVLAKFIGRGELQPLHAHNAQQLVDYIHWASTSVLKAASAPKAQQDESGGSLPPLGVPGADVDDPGLADDWAW